MRQGRRIILSFPAGFTSSDFTYTGTYTWVDDGGGSWRLKFLTSGTFTPKKPVIIDLFIVGGGGGGSGAKVGSYEGSGGGAGWANTTLGRSLSAGVGYPIVIGDGGAGGGDSADGGNGVNTTAFGLAAGGGEGGRAIGKRGGNGGSGGGGGIAIGGSNGSNGGAGSGYTAGVGQGNTTKEFGDSASSVIYSAGGGGAGSDGGRPGYGYGSVGNSRYAASGMTNMGDGGGGGTAGGTDGYRLGANGSSGICIIRNKR